MLYQHIVDDEIKMKSDRDKKLPWADADKYGWLRKQTGKRRSWSKVPIFIFNTQELSYTTASNIAFWLQRWFVVKDNCIFYFKKKGAPEPTGMIPLENLGRDFFTLHNS